MPDAAASQPRQSTLATLIPLLLILIAASYWILKGLGNGMLWQDEAQTALISRSILSHGVPMGFDGFNSFSQEQGADYGWHGLWKLHMWLPFYLLAGFFKLFHQSTTIARLPFALMGVATVGLCYLITLSLWKQITTAVITCVLLLACIPFVLLVRQCRYYSPDMFFSLLMLYAYVRMFGGAKRAWMLLVLAAVLLCNCQCFYCVTGFIAIGIHAAIWHRRQLRTVLLAGLLTALIGSPPVLWLASFNYTPRAKEMNFHFMGVQLGVYLQLLLRHVFPYPMLAIPALIALQAWWKDKTILPRGADLDSWALPLLFAVVTLLAAFPFTPWYHFRYMAPLIVPLIMVVGRLVTVAFRLNVLIGAAALLLLGFWWPIVDHMYEINHPFVGPLEGIAALLNERSRPGDVVAISYGELPVEFYTQLKVVGGATGQNPSLAIRARWLILRRRKISEYEIPLRQCIERQIQSGQYHQIELHVSDTPFENREEPDLHLFQSVTGIPQVVVWERSDTPSPKTGPTVQQLPHEK